MPIHFLVNDPNAGAAAPALRVQAKRPNRPAGRSGLTFSNVSPEEVAAPTTPGFLFWQCREAALAALAAWELSAGPHTKWQGNRKKLALLQDAGADLNAFYDRQSFSFFHETVGGTTFFSGASSDVVAHEVGHGLLDSIRPDFFNVNFMEVGAFHEAFGDCMAILTALSDKETRVKLLAAAPTLRKRNFVETTAENLSAGIKKLIPGHNAAAPRRAFNKLKYQLPQTLPAEGGPGALINEEHSFGMIFTGCFWDLIANIFNAATTRNEQTLANAAVTSGTILIAGAKSALLAPRFLQSVGRAMVLADQSLNNAANRDHIRGAFQAHDVLLGTNAMLAPSTALAGAAPVRAALDPKTTKDLEGRLGATRGASMSLSATNLFGTPMVNVRHERKLSLSAVDKRLKGVVCAAHDTVMVGRSGARPAVMGAMPQTADTDQEVEAFVKTLLDHDRIDFGGRTRGAVASAGKKSGTTHAVKIRGNVKVLERICFRCGGVH